MPSDQPIEIGVAEDATIKARGYWEQVWLRFRRDRLAIAGGITILLLLLGAFVGAPVAQALLGHGPNDLYFLGGVNQSTLLPVGPFTRIPDDLHPGHTTLFILGSDSTLGRDEFLRLLYGARASFEVALLATAGSIGTGVMLGAIAGYYRGWVDTVVSRVTEIAMAFPQGLFVIALASTAGNRLNDVTLGFLAPGVVTLMLIFSGLGWFFSARIVRSLVLSLREKEFVEAARMVGSSDMRIIRSHILPHLVGPIIVYSTLTFGTFILAEAGFSFLGVGIKLPTASWGNLLEQATQYYTQQPWLMVWPGLAVLITTLAFNLLGDGLRDAFDPRATL